ncbi:cleavage stimulation factor subunit 77 isoform X2 [Impatiens glandulifera]|uniref:cleavage stimulation factor subunit 77 isoform X2 n=1 Tax=Impatiens glandulifera TaxID=253017 RepID=UPI001FB16968|nr:cleavage stimulation factor subunit 77 isoform X2 [Impatiens glandulifera]
MRTSEDSTPDKYSVEAAVSLANEALRLPIADAVPIYDKLLTTFPTAAKYWKQYAEAHMVANNDDATKQIFSRCLLHCLQVPLWRCYLNFVRKANDKKGVDGQEETRKAFEFMLAYVGCDIGSGAVWVEYITFLKSLPAQSAQEESQRMTAIRKVYQKAVVTPTHHIEQIWRDYENFENSVSRALAKGLVSEYQPKYNSARAVYRELKKYVDEIDWNMLAVPPGGSSKEEAQWIAWKKLLAFEKENPQRIDTVSSNKRIAFTYEQCLMYLYHYSDVWYDYATWQATNVSIDSAINTFQRALKNLPDSEMLKYAYAELEESRGAIQSAKKVYESLIGDGVNVSPLSHIQYLRFLRRTEGVEIARKYFVETQQSPNCSYHVYVAYAMIAFCLDKERKIAHNVFEAGLNRFMHEPGYILEYADFLSRLNDEQNIRVLFERALSSLPQDKSIEVWDRFAQFEQTYGDLASMLKVERRRKEALSGTSEVGAFETSLKDIVSRYSFKGLYPCSPADLDHLARQDLLSRNISNKTEKPALENGAVVVDKGASMMGINSSTSYPGVSKKVIYDPRQISGAPSVSGVPVVSAAPSAPIVALTGSGMPSAPYEIPKTASPSLLAFITNLPAVEGPSPEIDFVLSICLQSNMQQVQVGKPGGSAAAVLPQQTGPAPSTSDLSGSSRPQQPAPSGSSFRSSRDRQPSKRKDFNRQDDDETTVQSQPLPKDIFRLRQMQKTRTVSQTGSTSHGSAFSGDLSGSTS